MVLIACSFDVDFHLLVFSCRPGCLREDLLRNYARSSRYAAVATLSKDSDGDFVLPEGYLCFPQGVRFCCPLLNVDSD